MLPLVDVASRRSRQAAGSRPSVRGRKDSLGLQDRISLEYGQLTAPRASTSVAENSTSLSVVLEGFTICCIVLWDHVAVKLCMLFR